MAGDGSACSAAAVVAVVEAVRAAVGPDIDLMLDAHGRLNVPTAIAMGAGACGVSTSPGSRSRRRRKASMRWRKSAPPVRIPIAAGERYFEPERFGELIAKRAVDILQPDVCHLSEYSYKRSASPRWRMTACCRSRRTIPFGPVMNAMTLHLAAAIPNFSIFETVMIDVPWRRELVK